ncbi:hypothetical protein ACFQ45_06635 [Rhodanobacter aciditrophus]|uniref:Restriction endonuclease n=1 Tax=Rhodanobacter aciditrophus TaxID=1623218 RepID=A0ABW4AYG8_9GAMM
MNWKDWTAALEKAVNSQIEACFEEREDGRWDENIITADILRALKKLHKDPVKVEDIYRSTSWNAYKLKGTSEKTHGDIALIVKIHLESGKSVEGVAFLEAKRITYGSKILSGSFSSIKWDRLKQYSESSPAHYTILYDYLPIGKKPTPLCRSMVTVHLLALNEKHRGIYKHSENISELLGYRLLMGHGLDYRDSIVLSAAGFTDSEIRYKYVVTADVIVSHTLELVVDNDPVLVNREKYGDIDSPEVKSKQEYNNDNGPSFGP